MVISFRAALNRAVELPVQIFIFIIKIYRVAVSPILPASCRFYPSCSAYSIQAYRAHGILKGSCLTAWRLIRCNPYCSGGHDPVPAEFRFFK